MKEKVADLNKNLRRMFHIHNKIKMYIIMKTFNIECSNTFDINVIDAKIVLHQGHILSTTPNTMYILFTGVNEYFYL